MIKEWKWHKYLIKNSLKLHKYNIKHNNEYLMRIIGRPGTQIDKDISKGQINRRALFKLHRKHLRRQLRRAIWWRLIKQMPMGRKCVKFRQRFIGQCSFYRRLMQINKDDNRKQKTPAQPDKLASRPIERQLKQKLSRKYRYAKQNYKSNNRSHKRRKQNIKRKRQLQKKHRQERNRRPRRNMRTQMLKKRQNVQIDDENYSSPNRRLPIGGAGGGGGMVAGAAPQIDDSRIIIHSFAAPPAPVPNVIRAYDENTHPQVIQARIHVPPKNILI